MNEKTKYKILHKIKVKVIELLCLFLKLFFHFYFIAIKKMYLATFVKIGKNVRVIYFV